MRVGAQIFIFVTFFPYPALAEMGAHTGVSVYELAAVLLCVAAPAAVFGTRSFRMLFAFFVTMVLSTVAVVLAQGDSAAGVAERAVLGSVLALSVLPAAGLIFSRFQWDVVVPPVSLAILVHAAAGLWQVHSFQQGIFPFRNILVNNSFFPFAGVADTYATYIARPFGLFPEPSAMAASLGPWVLFLIHWSTLQHVRYRRLGLLAAAAGSVLIVMSASVYVVFFIAALGIMSLRYLASRGSRIRGRDVLLGLGVIAAVVGFASYSAGRVNLDANTSLQSRLSSLVYGVQVPLSGARELLLGSGPGASLVIPVSGQTLEIYSIAVGAFAQGGLIALWVMVRWARRIGRGVPRDWRIPLYGSWVAGVVFATGYLALGPIWLFAAWALDHSTAPDTETQCNREELSTTGSAAV